MVVLAWQSQNVLKEQIDGFVYMYLKTCIAVTAPWKSCKIDTKSGKYFAVCSLGEEPLVFGILMS